MLTSHHRGHAQGDLGWRLVLPRPQDCPPQLSQLHVDCFVPGSVSRDLGGPPIGIRLWQGAMHGAAVPEASVDVDSRSRPGEGDVDGTSKLPGHGPGDSVAKPSSMQESTNRELRTVVPSSDGAHATCHLGRGGAGVRSRIPTSRLVHRAKAASPKPASTIEGGTTW